MVLQLIVHSYLAFGLITVLVSYVHVYPVSVFLLVSYSSAVSGDVEMLWYLVVVVPGAGSCKLQSVRCVCDAWGLSRVLREHGDRVRLGMDSS